MRIVFIINPISGTGGRPDAARRRAEMAAAFVERERLSGEVFVTEGQGHGRELTRAAIARGAGLVAAWGGDGTVNEVGSELAFGSVPLAIVPSGSGNGLARALGIPLDPAAALRGLLRGRNRVVDAGEIDGRLFFNIAGVGLDARVAHRFARSGRQRGLRRYVVATLTELFTYVPEPCVVSTETDTLHVRPLLVAVANGPQYGNGALIAPGADLSDGRLDVVVAAHRSPLRTLARMPQMFSGRVADVPGVSVLQTAHVRISAAMPLLYHADGEPAVGGTALVARIRPRALTVRVTA